MQADPRSELFEKVIELVGEEDLEFFSLGSFTKDKSLDLLEKLRASKDPKEDILEILSYHNDQVLKIEKEVIPFIDVTSMRYGLSDIPAEAPGTARCIGYLNDLVKDFMEGNVTTVASVSLYKDGKSSTWIPAGFDHGIVSDLFSPIVEELKKAKIQSNPN